MGCTHHILHSVPTRYYTVYTAHTAEFIHHTVHILQGTQSQYTYCRVHSPSTHTAGYTVTVHILQCTLQYVYCDCVPCSMCTVTVYPAVCVLGLCTLQYVY